MPTRQQLYGALADAVRDQAGRTVILHQAAADRFGLNSTDIKCLDLARNQARLTAGRLAEMTGMSTSAITSVLDRLERRGLIERRRDPGDRRKVIVAATGAHVADGDAIFERILQTLHAVLAEYDERTLEIILDFTVHLTAATRELTATL
jgi:DNA-binding MarR family transcriptional regulator